MFAKFTKYCVQRWYFTHKLLCYQSNHAGSKPAIYFICCWVFFFGFFVKLIWFFLGFLRSLGANNTLHGKKKDSAKCFRPSLHRESISFMKGVMDECTHMANFSGMFYGAETDLQTMFLIGSITQIWQRKANIKTLLQLLRQKTDLQTNVLKTTWQHCVLTGQLQADTAMVASSYLRF